MKGWGPTPLPKTFSELHLPEQGLRSVSSIKTAKHQAMFTVICQPYNSSVDRRAATGFDKCAVPAFHSKVC